MIVRAATFLFVLLAAAVASAGALDIYLHGKLTIFEPPLLGALLVLGTGFLLYGVITARQHARDLEARTDRLTALAAELESFIAALEAANARLESSEARYKGLVDAQGDAILRRTPDGRMTYANEAFYKLFGVTPEDIIGKVFRPELHPASSMTGLGRLAGREMGRERVSYDQHVKTVAGYRWIAWEGYAIRDAEERLVEIQSVGRDITERKTLEAALTEARDRAEEASNAKSRFLATMSHEIRTPMNGVLGMARLLLETPLAPDQKTYSDAIQQSGIALMALIEDILDFSKIESGALVLEKGEVALTALIEGITELLSTRAHAKSLEIVAAIAAEVPEIVQADGIRLRQVLTNLVGNAIKFTESGGVVISAAVERRDGGTGLALHLAVRDTGIGVPAGMQAHIFEDFVQADSSHARRFEGTGLGLAISKRLVDAMGGEIGLMPGEGGGSIFWVTLPLEEKSMRAPGASALKGRRVGVVSQSRLLRQGIGLQLAAAGALTVEAPGVEALARAPRRAEIMLVDVSGAESLPEVDFHGIPAVALLLPSQRARLAGLQEKGFAAYLMKPVRQTSLEQRLAAVLAGENPIETALPATPAPSPAGKGLSILLAEDNPVNALLARELLRRRGHRVQPVVTGEAAIEACALRRFDIVIMDVHMPRVDGIEATRRIRLAETMTGGKRTPIFALTADALDTGRKACLEAGMDGFLTKPVDPAELDSVLATIHPSANVAAE